MTGGVGDRMIGETMLRYLSKVYEDGMAKGADKHKEEKHE